MVSLVFFYILQLPHTVISNSEKLTHPNVHLTFFVTLLFKPSNLKRLKNTRHRYHLFLT